MIQLGDKVKDKVSGLVGIATERREYLNGCVQFVVTGKIKKDGTDMPCWSIDEGQLENLSKKAAEVKKKPTGGPTIRVLR